MKQAIDDLKNDLAENKNNIDNVYEFAIRQVEQNYKREKDVVKMLSMLIIVNLFINGFLAYRVSTTAHGSDCNAIVENGEDTYGETTHE